MCGVIALFYAGAVTGPAEERVKKVFSALVLALTMIMLGVVNTPSGDREDAPRACNRVEC